MLQLQSIKSHIATVFEQNGLKRKSPQRLTITGPGTRHSHNVPPLVPAWSRLSSASNPVFGRENCLRFRSSFWELLRSRC